MCQIPSMATHLQSPNKKPLNPHAPPFQPPKIPEALPNFPPYMFCFPNGAFQQSLQTTAEPVMTRRFLHLPVVTYHSPPIWSFYHHKDERYKACSFLQENLTPCLVTGDENGRCGTGVHEEKLNFPSNEYGFLDCNENINNVKCKSRVFSRRSRGPKKGASKKWAPKLGVKTDDGAVISVRSTAIDHELRLGGKTSLMIKNIPNQFERHDLLRILDMHCREENTQAKLQSDPCKSEYDFVYLPMDFGFRANLGYAFVNFTTAAAAVRFSKAFHNREWVGQVPGVGTRKKICEITCALIQGKDALKNHFERSKFPCHTNGYLPVVLSPPRDGSNNSKSTLVGRRTCIAAPPPVNRRKFILMMAKKGVLIN